MNHDDGIQGSNYFGGEPIRTVAEERVGIFKNGKTAGKDEVTGEMVKGGGDKMVAWVWRLCNIAFEKVRCLKMEIAVIVPLYKGKGEKTGYGAQNK